jgi:hypothetical protein
MSKGRVLTTQMGYELREHKAETGLPGCEIEYRVFGGPHPLPKILNIGQGYTTCNDTCLISCLPFYIPRTRYDYFVRRPDFAANHLDFICDQEPKILNILPLPPPSRDNIPLETTHVSTQQYGTN